MAVACLLFERVGDDIYNTTPVINPSGEVVQRYRKMFPFQPYETGNQARHRLLRVRRTGSRALRVSICYDMYFPETTRTLVSMG